MAAPFLLLLLLVASGGAFVGGDDGAGLTLRGIEGSGRGHASDAPSKGLMVMDYLKFTHGCGSFAALVARTTNAGEIFQEHVVAGTGGGLTVFCPDDLAVAAFEPRFNNLSAANQLAVLLHHGAAARYGREQLAAFEWVAVRTLAAEAATNKSLALTVRDDGDTMSLWPSPPSSGGSCGVPARVTKAVSSDRSPLAVYVVDAVLLPCHLRQLLEAAPCTQCGGYLGWLHSTISVWQVLLMLVGNALAGLFARLFVDTVMPLPLKKMTTKMPAALFFIPMVYCWAPVPQLTV